LSRAVLGGTYPAACGRFCFALLLVVIRRSSGGGQIKSHPAVNSKAIRRDLATKFGCHPAGGGRSKPIRRISKVIRRCGAAGGQSSQICADLQKFCIL